MRESVGQSGGVWEPVHGSYGTKRPKLAVHVTPRLFTVCLRYATSPPTRHGVQLFLPFVCRLLVFGEDHGFPLTEIEVRPIRISHLEWGWTWGLMMNAVPCSKVSRPFYEPSARRLASENGRASASAEFFPSVFFFSEVTEERCSLEWSQTPGS